MREIEFRGKDINTGNLVYGFLNFHYVSGRTSEGFNYTGESRIYSPEDCKNYTVHTNTIGQYTGRKDKNGTKIYSKDTIQISYTTLVGFNDSTPIHEEKIKAVIVEWDDDLSAFCLQGNLLHEYKSSDIEVLGYNIEEDI